MTLDDMTWGVVPHEIDRLVKLAAPFAAALPRDGSLVWFDPDAGEAYRDAGLPPGFGERAWLPIKTASGPLRPLFDAFQATPNRFNALFGGPTPLAGMAAGGLLGAGLGYGGGYLMEKLLGPKVLEPGRLRRVGALAGGGLGALPGAYLGVTGARMKAQDGASTGESLEAFVEPNVLLGKEADTLPELPELLRKSAEDAGGLYMPTIPVDAFNRVVWEDPNTPAQIRAATTGLVGSAATLRGGAQVVSPFDVGRIAVGMGSGLASGMVVGRVLGAMAGLTPDAKRTGMWAGALANVIPIAFGR